MPINESILPSRGNLTRGQKRQAETEIYGYQESPMQTDEIRTIDLNNPPKVPYTHQPFPAIVYNHQRRTHRVVNSQQDLAAALVDGWQTKPFPAEYSEPIPEVEIDATAEPDAGAVDEPARRGSGRSRRVTAE